MKRLMLLCSISVSLSACASVRSEEGEPTETSGGALEEGDVRNVPFAVIPLRNVEAGPGGYHIGVDLVLSNGYVPGHHSDDASYGANVLSTIGPVSYYKVYYPGEFPYGLFVDNENDNRCGVCVGQSCAAWCTSEGARLRHGWANKVRKAGVEIYPHDAMFGGLRLEVAFDRGGVAKDLGTVSLPEQGKPYVSRINGFVTRGSGGAPVAKDEVGIDFFDHGPPMKTSTGVPAYGFGSTSTNSDGYYNSGPLPLGTYKIYVGSRSKNWVVSGFVDLYASDMRLDIDETAPCAVLQDCTVERL